MRYINILIIIAVGVFTAASHTEESQLYVDNLSLEDGLSNNYVTAISQDKHGFLWVGTESGLNRFDGDNFVLYHENNSLLAGNSINALFYDADTSNPYRLHFVNMPSTGTPYGTSSANVRSVFQDSFGNVWLGNYSEGLDFISRTQPQFSILPYFSNIGGVLKENQVRSLFSGIVSRTNMGCRHLNLSRKK